MPVQFIKINEGNKTCMNKPSDTDVVYYSELTEWYTRNAFRSYSLKYVLEGTIYYQRKGMDIPLRANEVLVSGRENEVIAQFHSGQAVKSICIDVSAQTIGEVYACLVNKTEEDLLDKIIVQQSDEAWIRLETCPSDLFNGTKLLKQLPFLEGSCLEKDWIYQLAEQVVRHKFEDSIRATRLPYVKSSTRKEIYRRLKLGKEYIDEYFTTISTITQVARHCLMSEFHFIRSFQQIFGLSPYQYLLNRRLQHSIRMMEATENDLYSIALHCGFPDLATFSKAFNRRYGCPPSVYRSQSGSMS